MPDWNDLEPVTESVTEAPPTTAVDPATVLYEAKVQQKITLLQDSFSHEYDFTKDPPDRPMLLNYFDPEARKILGGDLPPTPFLPQGKVGIFVAPGGTGKTQALSQLAVAVATGQPWLNCCRVAPIPGKFGNKGRVLLALGEEDKNEISRRIGPFVRNHLSELTPDEKHTFETDLRKNLKPFALDRVSPRMLGAKPQYEEEAFFSAFCRMIDQGEDNPWRLIILDPGSRFMGPDCETDNNAATRFIELIEQLTRLPGNPTVLLAHHTRKGTGKGNNNKDAARGASALTDGARWVAQLTQLVDEEDKPTGTIELTISKSNYTVPPKPIHLRFVAPQKNWQSWLERVEAPAVETPKAKSKALAEDVKKLRAEVVEVRAELETLKKSLNGRTTITRNSPRQNTTNTNSNDIQPPEDADF